MIIAVDIDGILTIEAEGEGYDYKSRTPNQSNIEIVNKLYEKHTIILYTARFVEDEKVTKDWLFKNRVKYHRLVLGKLYYDYIVDDKAYDCLETLNEDIFG
jgi:uncharacterized HAD superfamily protein